MKLLIHFVVGCILVGFGYFNFHNNDDFFKGTFIDLVVLGMAYFISYVINEKNDHIVRRENLIESIISEIDAMVNSDNFVSSSSDIAYQRQMNCANRVKYLKNAKIKKIENDIEFIEEHIKLIRELYSNNEKDLMRVTKELTRHRSLISDKCVKIRMLLLN